MSQKSKELALKKFVQQLKCENYDLYKNKDSEMTDCTICLVEFMPSDDIIVLPCDEKHYFHKKCAIDWLQMKTECPLCRKDFSDDILKHVKTSNERMSRMLEGARSGIVQGNGEVVMDESEVSESLDEEDE